MARRNAQYKTSKQRLAYEKRTAERRVLARADSAIFVRHSGVDGFLKREYIRRHRKVGTLAANEWLAGINERLTFGGCFSWASRIEEFAELAEMRAVQSERIFKQVMLKVTYWNDWTLGRAIKALNNYAADFGVSCEPNIKLNMSPIECVCEYITCIKRLCNIFWWRRQLLTTSARKVEGVLRDIGAVRVKGQNAYVSNYSLALCGVRNRRNVEMLSSLTMVNQWGEFTEMADLVKASNANPENRRNELMVRIRGYEEVAKGLGCIGLFFTLTTPSAYHAFNGSGKANPNYEGFDPRAGAEWLNKIWARIRAAWAKEKIKPFGFRVAEPHHDGTPHYHAILFFNTADAEEAKRIFKEKALDEFSHEEGAEKARWDCISIDPQKGSAAGYIAKYVAKNIDGAHVGWDRDTAGADFTGLTAEDGAKRVRAWASVWGIRQFQQIGSVSVTVWREFRRKMSADKEAFNQCAENIQAIAEAADAGDWCAFVEAMGGPTAARKDRPVQPLYHETETKKNDYNEPVKRLIGLWVKIAARAIGGFYVATRENVWQVINASQKNGFEKADSIIQQCAARKRELNRVFGFGKGDYFSEEKRGKRLASVFDCAQRNLLDLCQ